MKKLLAIICICALTLTITACEQSINEVPEKAPSLEVSLLSQSVQAIQLSTSWNGNISSYNSDSPHPLQLSPAEFDRATLSLDNGNGEIELQFSDDYPPQEISAVRWLAEYATGNQDIEDVFNKSEPVAISGNIISIVNDENDYIYEVYARWADGLEPGKPGSGSSRYTFRTVCN